MLREEAKNATPEGFRLRQTMATGELVDDITVCAAVASQVGKHANQTGGSIILDGFPRTVGQAKCLDQMLRKGLPRPLILHLDVPEEVLVRRLSRRRQCAKCGAIYNLETNPPSIWRNRCRIDGGALVERDDDSEGIVAKRLTAYQQVTVPVLDYYRKRDGAAGIYRRIDGNRGTLEIAKELCEIVLLADTAVAA